MVGGLCWYFWYVCVRPMTFNIQAFSAGEGKKECESADCEKKKKKTV